MSRESDSPPVETHLESIGLCLALPSPPPQMLFLLEWREEDGGDTLRTTFLEGVIPSLQKEKALVLECLEVDLKTHLNEDGVKTLR